MHPFIVSGLHSLTKQTTGGIDIIKQKFDVEEVDEVLKMVLTHPKPYVSNALSPVFLSLEHCKRAIIEK